MKSTIEQLREIFADVFDNDAIVIDENTSAKDIRQWDSLHHLQLVVSIEKHFKIRFTATEILDWKTAGDMVKSINDKINTDKK